MLPLDPAAPNPRVARTALYLTTEQGIHIGREALDLYFEQNIGRPVKMQKIWVGEIEVIADEVYYVTDVYTWADALSPGRLFLSIKTGLRDKSYPGTVVGQFYYSLENLIALYLTVTKRRAERLLGQTFNEVVLGRPVHFATDPAADRLAEARLLQAAFRAGYETVYLQREPVAAAYSYEQTLDAPENVLVFDFGGGTLDITIMRLGGPDRAVLATGGIPIAGDVFDQKLVRHKLPRHFGEGSQYGPRHKALTVPHWIYDTFSDWQTILELNAVENREILRTIARTAQRRHQIEALQSFVSGNYGLRMFDTVEAAKRQLSEKRGAPIHLDGDGFSVREFVTRTEFEGLIRSEMRDIEEELLATVAASGLGPEQIDSIIRTGGSAQIPAFYEMLGRHFGPEKVRSIDAFSSVTAGLGISAYRQAQGEIDLQAHTAAEFDHAAHAAGAQMKVKQVNLGLLQRRIELAEQAELAEAAADDEVAVVLLGEPALDALTPTPLTAAIYAGLPAAPALPEWPVRRALVAPPDDQLLLLTTRYRFLLATARELIESQKLGLGLGDLHRLAQREVVCAVANWSAMQDAERLLIVTSTGFIRAYPLDILAANIAGPLPYQFETALPGIPVLVGGAARTDEVVAVTENRRGARWPVGDLPSSGVVALNCGQGEKIDRVTTAAYAAPDEALLLVLEDGYARSLLPEMVAVPAKPNQKGKALAARRSPAVALGRRGEATAVRVLTTSRLLTAEVGKLEPQDSTRTSPLLALSPDEVIQTLLLP